jgi:hypothetical protein
MKLIIKSKVFIIASYLNDLSYVFLGLRLSRVNQSCVNEGHPDYIHHNYYKIHRELLRGLCLIIRDIFLMLDSVY